MVIYDWIRLREHPESVKQSVNWFSSEQGVPAIVCKESIRTGIANKESIPQWYVVLDEKETIARGAGVIENDLHSRPDLVPNFCVLFAEPEKRKQGMAKRILAEIGEEMHQFGYEKLCLITDHTMFYKRYGWTFLIIVKEEGRTTTCLYQSDTVG